MQDGLRLNISTNCIFIRYYNSKNQANMKIILSKNQAKKAKKEFTISKYRRTFLFMILAASFQKLFPIILGVMLQSLK